MYRYIYICIFIYIYIYIYMFHVLDNKYMLWFQTSRNLVCFIMLSIILRQSDIVPVALTC